MKFKLLLILMVLPLMSFSQQSQDKNVEKKVMSYLAEAERYYEKGNMAMAEATYRKALAIAPENDLAQYNFGNLYINYKKENEALLNLNKASKKSKNESIKHKSLHNQGNILMEKKKYAQAAKAYKEALKNDPTDDETRYNYALAKELMEKQKQKQNKQNKKKNKNKDKKKNKKQDQNKKGGEGENQKDKKDEKGKSKDESKKDKDKKGKPKEDKEQDKKAKQDQQKQSDQQEKKKARKAKLSKQQVKNILKAIENSEKKVQKKLNKKKQEGKPVRTEKDW